MIDRFYSAILYAIAAVLTGLSAWFALMGDIRTALFCAACLLLLATQSA